MCRRFTLMLSLGLLLAACDSQAPQIADTAGPHAPDLALYVEPDFAAGKNAQNEGDRAALVQAYLDRLNDDLARRGLNIAVQKAEWIGGGDGHEAGQTVYANDRTLHIDSQWIPGDEYRNADGNNLTYVVDQSFAAANTFNPLPSINAEPSIDASFGTWEAQTCSNLNIVKRPDTEAAYSAILDFGVEPSIFHADISTIGFLPGAIFDAVLGPGASQNVLGITFTFIWTDDDTGDPTDLNGDGYLDTALAEVWYNDAFGWATNGSDYDIETVALHENGHALGLGHFGRVSVTEKNSKLHVSPRAVMNAFILGSLRAPLGTDQAAFCSLYDSWPV